MQERLSGPSICVFDEESHGASFILLWLKISNGIAGQ